MPVLSQWSKQRIKPSIARFSIHCRNTQIVSWVTELGQGLWSFVATSSATPRPGLDLLIASTMAIP